MEPPPSRALIDSRSAASRCRLDQWPRDIDCAVGGNRRRYLEESPGLLGTELGDTIIREGSDDQVVLGLLSPASRRWSSTAYPARPTRARGHARLYGIAVTSSGPTGIPLCA